MSLRQGASARCAYLRFGARMIYNVCGARMAPFVVCLCVCVCIVRYVALYVVCVSVCKLLSDFEFVGTTLPYPAHARAPFRTHPIRMHDRLAVIFKPTISQVTKPHACSEQLLCSFRCTTMRNCGRHQCRVVCHDGPCPPCREVRLDRTCGCATLDHACLQVVNSSEAACGYPRVGIDTSVRYRRSARFNGARHFLYDVRR